MLQKLESTSELQIAESDNGGIQLAGGLSQYSGGMQTGAGTGEVPSYGAGPELAAGARSEDDILHQFKLKVYTRLQENHIVIDRSIMLKILDVNSDDFHALAVEHRKSIDTSDLPMSWDYVFAFRVADADERREPTENEKENMPEEEAGMREWEDGMPKQEWNGQVMEQMKKDLEAAGFTTRMFASRDQKHVFIICGMTEAALGVWADIRDIDLLIDPTESVREGRVKDFPLALRTYLDENDEVMDPRPNLPVENWEGMHVKYDQGVNQKIYQHYQRLPGLADSIQTPFSEKTRLRLMYECIIADKAEGGAQIEVIDHLTAAGHPLVGCFPLHNPKVLENFDNIWLSDYSIGNSFWVPLSKIRDYFGEPVAFYFAFMMFYMKWLVFPSCVGVIFLIIQLAVGLDNPSNAILCLMVIFWCVAFVDFWVRQENRFRLLWGMTKFEDKAVARPQFTGEWTHDVVTGLWVEDYSFILRYAKSGATISFILAFMAGCIAAVLSVLLVRDSLNQGDNINQQMPKIGLGVANGCMISVFDFIYRYGAFYGTEWENHRTEQDYQNALIFKAFVFKFFNSFASLFYLSFARSLFNGTGYYLRSYDQVCSKCDKSAVQAAWAAGVCSSDGAEVVSNPNDKDYLCCFKDGSDVNSDNANKSLCGRGKVNRQINQVILEDLRIQLVSLFLTAIIIQNAIEVAFPWILAKVYGLMGGDDEEAAARERGEAVPEKSAAEEQLALLPYENTIEDMSEIMIQFGYVTLFVMALPIIPLMALVNNVIELKVDGNKLVHQSQRPHVNGSSGLGAWNSVLNFFSLVAVGTNVALLTFRTSLVQQTLDRASYSWIFFSMFSILLSLIVSMEKALIADVPLEVTQGIERQRLIENVLVMGARLEKDDDEPPNVHEDEEEFPFSATKPKGPPLESIPLIPLGDLTQLAEA